MSSIDNEDDPSFLSLSARLRCRIDNAFDSVAPQSTPEVSPGVEPGPSQYAPGGFIIEDVPPESSARYIPLSEIPRALNLLDLSPDDDILDVFKNAVTGWGARGAHNDGVGRKDWRAVCSALLEGEDVEENPVADEDIEMGADSGSDSDEYQMEEQSGDTSEEALSDEYVEQGMATRANARKAQRAPTTRAGTKSSGTRQLTESQRAQCRQEFGRFFPHVPDEQLDRQRIMIKDIVRVAEVLKENLKMEEMLEMLEAFSTSPDKSMNLADFERMMIATKLV